jgi:23S rRNA (cytidine2498-2'-O)-methyltransferase
VGAERALKTEMARLWPHVHPAFSRPGFITFKLGEEASPDPDVNPAPTFSRAWSHSIDRVSGEGPEQLAAAVTERVRELHFDRLHIWQRETVQVGFRGFEPGMTDIARQAGELIRAELAKQKRLVPPVEEPALRGEQVLDVVMVEPNTWYLGHHRAISRAACWPGGIPEITLPDYAVSRAYLKMEEAIRWSGLPMRKGNRCAEIGCSPGGASQALLDRGLKVMGIDPAEVAPVLLENPRFTHVRKRGAELRRREFRDVDWLTADINVAPQYTLDTVQAIVTHPAVAIRGLLLTLKLVEWQLANELPEYLERIRSWGYAKVEARQLAHNRQEVCVAASRDDLKPRLATAKGARRKRQEPHQE